MGQPAAKQGDRIVANDIHRVLVPVGTATVLQDLEHPFDGKLDLDLSANVKIMGRPAAIVGSRAKNTVEHKPTSPGTAFLNAPSNEGTISSGSETVRINTKAAARDGDSAVTCNDPVPKEGGRVVASATVFIG